MSTIKVSNEVIFQCNDSNILNHPKYTGQIINLANQNAGGTRPRVVGQLSELFPEYLEQTDYPSIEDWQTWYEDRYPEAIETATQKVLMQLENLKNAVGLITDKMVKEWVSDLIISKTFNGMYFQKTILRAIAQEKNTLYRLADKQEEAKGIDGMIGKTPVSIKPTSYEIMHRLPETIDVEMIYYEKVKTGIVITYNF